MKTRKTETHTLDETLQALSIACSSIKEKDHFLNLQAAIRDGDFPAAFQLASSKVGEGFLFKSKYQGLLTKLIPHLNISNEADKNIRLEKLITAIQSTDPYDEEFKSVKDALNKGSAIVIDEVNLYGESALAAAFKTKNKDLILYLINKGASLDFIANDVINDEGETPLHIACDLLLYDVISVLLSKTDPNVKRKDGVTPLYLVCKNNDTQLAILLMNRGADPNIGISNDADQNADSDTLIPTYLAELGEITPFTKALKYKNNELIKIMMENYNYHVTDLDLELAKEMGNAYYDFIKEPIRKRRHDIKQSGPLSILKSSNEQIPESLKVIYDIYDRLYIENNEMKTQMKELLEHEYLNNKRKLLMPLFELVALATQGGHHRDEKLSDKKLKILLTKHHNVSDITGASIDLGRYQRKNTVYASQMQDAEHALITHAGFTGQTLGILLHELQHFAEDQIYIKYKDKFKPYEKDPEFKQMKNELAERSAHLYQVGPKWDRDRYIYSAIYAGFKQNKGKGHEFEILAKVPEILGYLGMESGYNWLKTHEPRLLAFYESRFIPDCNAYLTMQKEVFEHQQKKNIK